MRVYVFQAGPAVFGVYSTLEAAFLAAIVHRHTYLPGDPAVQWTTEVAMNGRTLLINEHRPDGVPSEDDEPLMSIESHDVDTSDGFNLNPPG